MNENQEADTPVSEEAAGETFELVDPYDADGNHMWEHVDTGEPVDALGNPISATRPAPEIVAEVPPDPEPVVAAPPAVLRSPFADGFATPQQIERWSAQIDPEAMPAVAEIARQMAQQTIAADRQHRIAARQLGLPPDIVDDYAGRMADMQQFVPANMHGTKEGAIFAAALAAAQEGVETGDIGAVFRKLGGAPPAAPVPVSQPAAAPRQPLPPSSVSHTPNANPETVRQMNRSRTEKTIAGMTSAEMAVINADRAQRNGGLR